MNKKYLETYSNFLIASTKSAHSTDLQKITDSEFSKDSVYRFLSSGQFCEKNYWLSIRKTLRSVEDSNACISFDDTIVHKPHSQTNEVIEYYWDHTINKSVKGINILSCTYQTKDISLPLNYRVIRKNKTVTDENGESKRKAEFTKNQSMRAMLKTAKVNKIKYRYVLADSWYTTNENLKYIHKYLNKLFVCAIKTNRVFKFLGEDFKQFRKLNKGNFQPGEVYEIELKGCLFPVFLTKQVFKNEDGKEASLYLITNDEFLNYDSTIKVYKKRWNIEVYHKSLKQNCSMGKATVRTVQTIIGHIFCSIYSYVKLEKLKMKTQFNHFKLKTKYYLLGLKETFLKLSDLKTA